MISCVGLFPPINVSALLFVAPVIACVVYLTIFHTLLCSICCTLILDG